VTDRKLTWAVSSRGPVLAAVARMVTAGACWGLAAVMAKTAFDRGVPPVRMAEARVLVALVLLAGILAWSRPELLRPPAGAIPAVVGFGLSVAAVNATYYVAIDHLPVGVAVSLQYTAPVLLLGLAAATGRRALGRLAWLAAAITLAGAVLVSRAYGGLVDVSGIGLLAAAGAALTFATYLLTAGRAGRQGVPPATVLFWGFVVAVVAWSVVAPWWSWPVEKLAQTEVLLSVLGVGIVGTLFPFFLAVGAVRVLPPAIAGIAATVEPPFAAGFAWLFLGQHLSPVQFAGGILVLAGVILAQRTAPVVPEALAVEPAS
jgi:drug/metabolite transporter (DMT)-like permease